MILKEPNLDKDKQGRKTLNNYRKKIKFNKIELKNYSHKDKLKIYLSKISLDSCCKILSILEN